MRPLARWIFALGAILCVLGSADAYWQSRLQVAITGGGGGGFQGMADVVASPAACWSLRACSAAVRGTRAVNVCNVSDVTCADLSTDATTGNLVITTIGGSNCSVVICTVKTIYDQTVGTACGGSPCNMTQATIASRPVFTVSCVSSLPCMTFDNSFAQFLAASGNTGTSLPMSISVAAKQTGGFGVLQAILKHSGGGFNMGFDASSNIYEFAGNLVTATGGASTSFAVQAFISGAGSGDSLYVNGTLTGSLNAGTTAASGNVELSGDGGGQNLTGVILEAAIWAGNKTASNSAMNSNQRTYWGF